MIVIPDLGLEEQYEMVVEDRFEAPDGATENYVVLDQYFSPDCLAVLVFNQSSSSVYVSFKDQIDYSQTNYVILPAAGSYGSPMIFIKNFPPYFRIKGTVAAQYVVLVRLKRKGGSRNVEIRKPAGYRGS